jgi:hypothetical protein
MQIRFSKRAVIAATAALVLAGAGTAYAFISGTGTGGGSGSVAAPSRAATVTVDPTDVVLDADTPVTVKVSTPATAQKIRVLNIKLTASGVDCGDDPIVVPALPVDVTDTDIIPGASAVSFTHADLKYKVPNDLDTAQENCAVSVTATINQ